MDDVKLMSGRIVRNGVEYGCHCDAVDTREIDGCVIDDGRPDDCNYGRFPSGRARRSQWTCKFWKPVRKFNTDEEALRMPATIRSLQAQLAAQSEALKAARESLLLVRDQIGEGIHTGLRRYCDSRAASDAHSAIMRMPGDEWGLVIAAFLDYADVNKALAKIDALTGEGEQK